MKPALRRQLRIVLGLGALAAFLIALGGCGSSGSNSNSNPNPYCTATGCYPGNGFGPYGNMNGLGPNSAVYTSENVSITNGATWDQFMQGAGGCAAFSCSGVSYNPTIELVVVDDTFSQGGSSPGQVIMVSGGAYGFGAQQIPFTAPFRAINGNSGFATGIQTGPTYTGWGSVNSTGSYLTISVNGSPTAGVGSTAQMQLQVGTTVVGYGTLVRTQ